MRQAIIISVPGLRRPCSPPSRYPGSGISGAERKSHRTGFWSRGCSKLHCCIEAVFLLNYSVAHRRGCPRTRRTQMLTIVQEQNTLSHTSHKLQDADEPLQLGVKVFELAQVIYRPWPFANSHTSLPCVHILDHNGRWAFLGDIGSIDFILFYRRLDLEGHQ